MAAYHLQMFGVIPERHRQGIGRGLIEFVEEKVCCPHYPKFSFFETIMQAKAINVDLCLESLGPEDLVMHMVSPLTVTYATYLTNMLYK